MKIWKEAELKVQHASRCPTIKSLKKKVNSTARSKVSYHNDADKSRADSAARSKASYPKDANKSKAESTARSKASYHMDMEKSKVESTTRSNASYPKDTNKSKAESTASSKASYHKDMEKSKAESTGEARPPIIRTRTRVELIALQGIRLLMIDIKASRTYKRQRYVVLCAYSFNYLFYFGTL